MAEGSRGQPVSILRPGGGEQAGTRTFPIEAAIAVEYNGIGYAVMMATPADLEDFATGFSLSERVVEHAGEIGEILPHETPQGWLLRIAIPQARLTPIADRVRARVSEGSCGLCGLESLEQVARDLPPLSGSPFIATNAIFAALAELRAHQSLNEATGGVHGAAFCDSGGRIQIVREDVGRHNALDKLIGALARTGTNPEAGFILSTARCSYELVEKAALARCGTLVTVSTATSLAADRAKSCGLRLIALARPDAMLEITLGNGQGLT